MEGGKENTQPGQESGLARMFREGNKAIGTHKTSDLFKQLESRSLTEDEQTIIQQRLDLQRKMLLAYETREKARKIQDLQQVCPELTEEEAERALNLCNGREDVAAGQIVSDPAFRRRLQPASAAPVPRTGGATRKSATWNAKPSGRRPKQVDATSLGSSVFVGAFRGGKRGGSRTAHLHSSAADATSSEADLPVTTWRTSRPRSRQKADHPADEAASSRQNRTQAQGQPEHKGEREQQQDEEEGGQAEQIEEEEAEAEEKDEEEEEEEEDDHIEEDEEAGAAAAAPMHAEESWELMFEADVVDALANLPSSQPLGVEPHSNSTPAIATGVQLPLRSPGLTADAVLSTPLSPNTGVRQSRRLAALAEAPSHAPSDAHAAQQQGTAPQQQGSPPQQQGTAPHQQGMAPRQQGTAPQQAEQTGVTQSAALLQASTLEASANVLKGLTVATGVKFLSKMQAEAMQGTLDALQGLDSVKADLLRAQLFGSNTVSQQQAVSQAPQLLPAPQGLAPNSELPSADLHSPPTELDGPSADPQVPQQTLTEKGTAGKTVMTSKVPKQASSDGDDPQQTSPSASPDAEASFPGLAPAVTQSKKRKADKAEVTVEGDATAAMEAEHAESAQQAEEQRALPKQAAVRSGGGPKKKQGTLQAAFAKAKGAGLQGLSSNETHQKKKRSTKARAVSNQDTESLPDQAMDLSPEQATEDEQKKRSAEAEAAPDQLTASEQPKKRGRSIRARRSPDQDMVDAVISNAETEEEDEASDTDFVAVAKGSRKRVRAAANSPTKKQKRRARPQPQSPSHASPPSSSAAKKAKTAEPVSPGSAPGSSSSPSDAVKQRRSRRPSVVARLAEEEAEQAAAIAAAASPPKQNKGSGEGRRAKAGSKAQGFSAIARSGHTNRGRVKQKSHKAANILEVGSVRAEKGWYNSGYIFPEGFKSQLPFRSSVELDQLCLHECTIIGKGGAHWPHPTYKVVAMDRADEPLLAKSCTGCWTQVLKRINSEIEARRKAGENLPPPPKTAIAGPEYFGLNQPELTEAIEALDPQHECSEYWDGKADREAAAAGLAPADMGPRPPRPSAGGAPRPKRSRRAREGSDEGEAEPGREDEEDDESANMTNRWSAVSRTERYRKRCGDEGNPTVDETNPLPKLIDPITLEPVVTPAISPFGHVMGLATWKAVLAEQGKCPFTKNDLSWEQCTTLTLSNIDRYRDRMKSL